MSEPKELWVVRVRDLNSRDEIKFVLGIFTKEHLEAAMKEYREGYCAKWKVSKERSYDSLSFDWGCYNLNECPEYV